MQLRTKQILQKSIDDFIKTGRPVTSEYLYSEYDFGIKPAMIRRELNFLDSAGYLSQAHSSSGREPTDKAYKFFVKDLLGEKLETEGEGVAGIIGDFLDGNIEIFVRKLSGHLKALSITYEPENNNIYKNGLDDLITGVESRDKDDLLTIIRDFELLSERFAGIHDRWFKDKDSPQVFIGKNPVIRSTHLSVVAYNCDVGGGNVLMVAIGPKRMDYRKFLGFFHRLSNYITNN